MKTRRRGGFSSKTPLQKQLALLQTVSSWCIFIHLVSPVVLASSNSKIVGMSSMTFLFSEARQAVEFQLRRPTVQCVLLLD